MSFTSYDAAVHSIGRARGLLQGARPQISVHDPITGRRFRGKGGPKAVARADMRRLSVVMAVAALDTYMHRLILERVYTHDRLPKQLARLDVDFARLLEQADATGAAARADPHSPRPRVGIKRLLRDRLLRETFQTYEGVSHALHMAGRSREWPEIGKRMTPERSPEEIKDRLNEIVKRRNQIVHEGDYARLEKPQGPRRNEMSTRQARADIDFIEQTINAIHEVVS